VALDHYDAKSGTPSYKSTPVLLLRASQNGDRSLSRPAANNAKPAVQE